MKELKKEIIEKDGNRFITFPLLLEHGIKNIMTTKDFNLGLRSCGIESELKRQYDVVKELLNEKDSPLYLLEQEHTDLSIIAQEEGENEKRAFGFLSFGADGLITNKKNIVTVSTVADCVPVIILDKKNKVFSNIHSGWKGTLKNIVGKTIEKMIKVYGTDPKDILAFIGPHIQKNDFEVRDDVVDLFKEKYPHIEGLIKRKSEEHFLIDLNLVLIDCLKSIGVEEDNIYISYDSTVSLKDTYHSFRRDGKSFGIMGLCAVLV